MVRVVAWSPLPKSQTPGVCPKLGAWSLELDSVAARERSGILAWGPMPEAWRLGLEAVLLCKMLGSGLQPGVRNLARCAWSLGNAEHA